MRRYAIYYAPRSDEPLAAFARAWLGRDPESGAACDQVTVPGISSVRLKEITTDPRRYGFHGTLKPPFHLTGGNEANFLKTVQRFAATHLAFEAPPPKLVEIGRFLALTPDNDCRQLDDLAAACVRAFDSYRAPPSATELARRRAAGLTARQDELLARWGYPYVFDEFRFHLTLTGNLDEPERDAVHSILTELTEPYCRAPLPIRDICVFVQDSRGQPFRIIGRFALGGG